MSDTISNRNTRDALLNKKSLGQFFTTNYKYIMNDISIPSEVKHIIEPFAGNKDLLKILDIKYDIKCYDIDPKFNDIEKKDTLLNPPNYKNKYIITNPPYLARNKSNTKAIFDKYNQNDLYKCFIHNIIQDQPDGGIIIIPLNFWCSIRKNDIDLRKKFIKAFDIIRVNLFEERVFDDTSYAVCCIQFNKKIKENSSNHKILNNYSDYIKFIIYPTKSICLFELNKKNNYSIGGEIYMLPQNKNIKIDRLTKKNKDFPGITYIKLHTIDNNVNSQIRLEINKNRFIDNTKNLSERTFATLIIIPILNDNQQDILVKLFNKYLNIQRKKYNSLFLTNYRESKDMPRKRISFDLVYKIINYIMQDEIFTVMSY